MGSTEQYAWLAWYFPPTVLGKAYEHQVGRLGSNVTGTFVKKEKSSSLASRQLTVVFGLETRLHVYMGTKLENGVLSNGQQPQSVVNGFC